MDFDYAAQGEGAAEDGSRRSWRARLSEREALRGRRWPPGDRWQPVGRDRGAEAEGARRRAVEPVPAGVRARRGPDQPGVRAAVRDHGARALGAGGLQLLGARHRQHGSARALRHAEQQKRQWLEPLLDGKIRSCFAMTEPAVASSDATNIESRIERDGDDYVINGRKWWSSGAADPRCKIVHLHGQDRSRQSRPPPAAVDDPGAARRAGREDRARRCRSSASTTRRTAMPRCCSRTCACRSSNMLLGEGRGFEIAQGRLGPGRIHHCMRAIGLAERALEMMCKRAEVARRLRQADRRADASRGSASPRRASRSTRRGS